jgi:hypothetical protein
MTATSNELTAPSRGLVAAHRHSMPRNEFFAVLYILGCANGLLGRGIHSFNDGGWRGAVVGVEMNVIVLAACFAGVYLIAILFFANDGAERRRGALVLLALAVPMLWSRLVFQFIARPLLELDAAMAAWMLGTERTGNLVRFADDSGYMVISPGCASWANVTFAFLAWVVVSQWFDHRWRRIDSLWLFFAVASVVAMNVTRIALTGLSQGYYTMIHEAESAGVILNTVPLCFIIVFCAIGARRELLARA